MINNLKKVISSAAAVAILASSASAFAVSFPDVDESASYADDIATVAGLGVIVGDENGLFNPDNNVTRAEFTTMVVRALGEEAAAKATVTSSFTDASNTDVHWAAGYIAQGVSDGWINGYGDGTFQPNNTVTYQEAVKMLVSAIGYELYAQKAGGYPSGYLTYGNTTGIIDGVSVESQTTALTRSQCAVLVNNAMKAPLVLEGDIVVGGTLGTITEQSYTTMDGQGQNWQSLLTKFHDAYVVRGRVMETSKSQSGSGLDDNEVTFRVEAADNFDGEYYGNTGSDPVSYTMSVGDTDAADRIFEYCEAVVQKDKASDEWTIVSISTYGQSKTEEFDAADVDDEDAAYPADAMVSSGRIPVFKTATSTSTTKYRLAEDVAMYVNGVEIQDDLDVAFNEYVINNAVGKVMLIDSTEPGSTSTDGYYDFIMVDYYVDAVVDSVNVTSADVRMFFKAYENNDMRGRLQWDPEDEDVTVNFTKADAEIAYTDVAEFDVLSIAYDVVAGFENSSFYEVIVSDNKIVGRVSSRDTEDAIVTVDGTDYEANEKLVTVSNIELSTEYTLYLDAFGYIAYTGEGETAKNYGILVGMYTGNGDDTATVRMIQTDGAVHEYLVRDEDQDLAWNILNDTEDVSYPGTTFSKTMLNGSNISDNVIVYSFSSGKLRIREQLSADNSNSTLQYRTSGETSRLGSYTISDAATTIIDIDTYLNNDNSNAGVMSVSSFSEDTDYGVYVYDKSSSSTAYRFVVVFSGLGSIQPDTTMAVVKSRPGTTDVNGNEYLSMTVCRNGQEDVTLLYEDIDESFNEGDVVIYTQNSDGTVDTGNLYKVVDMTGLSSNESLRDSVLALDNFSSFVSSDVLNATTNEWAWSSNSKEAQAYFGPVLRKDSSSIELITSQTDGQSDVTEATESFTIDSNSLVYVYDYSRRTNQSQRVYAGQGGNSTAAIFKGAYADDKETIIDWATVQAENIKPNYALVKVVDNDVTEVVIFLAD